VLALLEVTPAMQPMLDALARRYPHSALRLRDDPFGIAVFAHQPLVGARFEQRDGEPLVLAAQLALVDGSQVALRVLHLAPPLNREMLAIRDGVLRRLAREPLSDRAGPGAIAVGDFNATAWTPAVRELAAAGWSRATPLVPTWNFVLPIDHVLATRGRWQMEHSGVGPRTGSDHRPVWADLVLRPAAAPER